MNEKVSGVVIHCIKCFVAGECRKWDGSVEIVADFHAVLSQSIRMQLRQQYDEARLRSYAGAVLDPRPQIPIFLLAIE